MYRPRRNCMVWALPALLLLMLLGAEAFGRGVSSPSIVGEIRFEEKAVAVAAAGHLAFVLTDTTQGETHCALEIVSLEDPSKPTSISSVTLGKAQGSMRGLLVVGRWLFVTIGGDDILALDIADPADPLSVAWDEVPEAAKPRTPEPRTSEEVAKSADRTGDVLFTVDGGDVRARALGLTSSVPSAGSPVVIPTPGSANDVLAAGDLLFVADGQGGGLTVFRLVADPTAYGGFTVSGGISIPTPGSAEAVAVVESAVLVVDGLEGLAIITGPIPPGSVTTLPTPGRAVDVAVAEDLAVVATEEEGIQIVSLPSALAPLVLADRIPGQVEDVRVTGISPDTDGATMASYTLTFTPPLRGGLGPGNTIVVKFPSGAGLGALTVSVNGVAFAQTNVERAGGVAIITLPEGTVLPGGSPVILSFFRVTNPPRGANYTLAILTTASPVVALSDPFAIGDDLLAWLNVRVGAVLAAINANVALIQADVAAIRADVAAVKADVAGIRGDVAKIQAELTLVFGTLNKVLTVLNDVPDLLEGVNDRLDVKVELEEQLLEDLADLAETLLDMHDYLYEKLGIEWELLDAVDRLEQGLQQKIALETAIRDTIVALERCLRQLQITGTVTPPAEPRDPIDVVLALDSSGSMADNDPNKIAISGAKAFMGKLDAASDQAGVVSWDDGINLSKGLSSDLVQRTNDLNGVDQDGGTDLNIGLAEALALLQQGGRADARKVIVFLTDGDGDYTSSGQAGSVVDRAKASGVVIYAIGLGAAPDEAKLKDMAIATGGKYFHAVTAGDLIGVYAAIVQELMNPWQVNLNATCP